MARQHFGILVRASVLVVSLLLVTASVQTLTPIAPRLAIRIGKYCNLLEFSPDGKTIATLEGEDSFERHGPIRLWHADTGLKGHSFEAGWCKIDRVLFSPDGAWLAATDRDGGLKVWEVSTGEEIARRSLGPDPHYDRVVLFSPDARLLAYETSQKWSDRECIKFLDCSTALDRGVIAGYASLLVFSADGTRAGTVLHDPDSGTMTASVWNLSDGPEAATILAQHRLKVDWIVFSPNLTWFASVKNIRGGDAPVEIDLCDAMSGTRQVSASFPDLEMMLVLRSSMFTPGGNFLRADGSAGGWGRRRIQSFLLAADRQAGEVPLLGAEEFSADDRWMAIRTPDGAKLMNLHTMQSKSLSKSGDSILQGQGFRCSDWGFPSLCFSPDAKIISVPGLVHTETANPLVQWISDHIVKIGGDSSRVVTRVWSTESGRQLATLPGFHVVRISADGRTLLALDKDGPLTVWDMPPRPPLGAVLRVAIPIWLSFIGLFWLARAWYRRRNARTG